MSKDTSQVISNRKPYYTQIDNMLMVVLNPYQYMLLSQYYRICSLPSQQSTISDKKMATLCGFGISKVKSTRKELSELGYINIDNRNATSGSTQLVTVNDVQDKNFKYWTERNFVTSELEGGSHEITRGSLRGNEGGSYEVTTNKNKSNKNINTLQDESCDEPTDKIIPYEDDVRMGNSVGARIKQDQLSTVVTPSDNSIPKEDEPNPLDAQAEQIPTKENEAMNELIADAKRKASDNALALSEVIPDLLDLHNRREWNIAHMLSGTSTKTGYKEYAPYFTGDNMVTPDELSKVVAYYRQECEGTHIIQSPEIVSDWVGKYRNSVKANTEQDNTTKRAMMMRASLIPQQEPEEG